MSLNPIQGSSSDYFLRFNDQDGSNLVSLNKDGSVFTQGLRFNDGTVQQTAGAAAGLGPFTGDYYWYPPFEGNRSAGAFYPGTLAMAVMPVLINRNLNLTHAAIGINGVSSAANVYYYFAIYDSNGNLLTYAKFPVGTGNPTGQVSVSLSSPINLTAGIWRFCQGSDDTGSVATGQNYQFDTDLQNLIPNVGNSSNLISGGLPPATLGTVSGAWPDSAPFIMLY